MLTYQSYLQPIGEPPEAEAFFNQYLAAVIVIVLYIGWKIKTRGKGGFFVKASEMDLVTGMRQLDLDALEQATPRKKSIANLPKRTLRSFI